VIPKDRLGEFISGPSLGPRAKFFTFSRTQSRVVTGLLMGHNTLRRHLCLLGLLDSPLCRKRGVRKETSAHILYECEALALLGLEYLGSFFLEPEDIKSLGLGPSGTIVRLQGSHDSIWGTKGPSNQGLGASGLTGPKPECKSISHNSLTYLRYLHHHGTWKMGVSVSIVLY
jgi:hypothetical protein